MGVKLPEFPDSKFSCPSDGKCITISNIKKQLKIIWTRKNIEIGIEAVPNKEKKICVKIAKYTK